MKKKNKTDRTDHYKKYRQVCAALAYFSEMEYENKRKEEARRKTQRFLSKATLFGSIALLAINFVTDLSFDVSWMANFGEWFSEIYVAFMTYTFLTALVLFFEKKFKFDQRPAFGYIWPFIGFFISLFLSKTITASLVPASFNYIIGISANGALLAYLWISSFVKLGKEEGERELNLAKKASEIIKNNPEIVEEVFNDYEKDTNQDNK